MGGNLISFCLLLLIESAISFYVPGVTPKDYTVGEPVELLVNALSSLKKSLIPYDYYYDSFHFCRPAGGLKGQSESLGSILFGDRLFSSDFKLQMMKNKTCQTLCQGIIPGVDAVFINDRIREKYLFNWMVDGLPAAQKSDTGMESSIPGFHLGQRIKNNDTAQQEIILLNNHFEIYILFHTKDDVKYRVVGVFVNPSSTESKSCEEKVKNDQGMILNQNSENQVIYTYDVYWLPSNVPWGSRWDHYLYSSDDKIHWFSLINSVIVAILLSAIVFGILLRALKMDISRYNEIEVEDHQEEFGWKMIHGDVFRSPSNRMILSVLVGNGAQILLMAELTIICAALGFLSPSNRGSLATVMIVFYFLCGSVAGYVSARFYKMCGGQAWKQNVLMTSLLVPGSIFMLLLLVNILFIAQNSSSAVPFGTMFALLALWFFLSIPLSFGGAFLGFTREKIQVPVRTLQIPRQVPEQPFYLQFFPAVVMAGILPFGALFIELLYILNSIWANRIYYVFGFLMLVFLVLILTTSLVAIIVCYIALCAENYHWWWRSFFAGASCGAYVFLYGIVYYINYLELSGASSAIIYFAWTGAISAGLGLMTGTAGFVSCFLFIRQIYSSIKID